MALFNHAKREINAKIVYYGHEGTGKSASIHYIYNRIRPALRGELKTLPTGGDSLLFFDFSPFDKPVFGGYRLRYHIYSLTGKIANPATWKMTLKGADGLVIVASDSPERFPAARESVCQLREFLAAYGTGLADLPCVLQLDSSGGGLSAGAGMSAADLGLSGVATCFASVAKGEGILDAFSQLSREVVARIGRCDALREKEKSGEPDNVGGVTDIEADDFPESCDLLDRVAPAAVSGQRILTAEGPLGGDGSALRINLAEQEIDSSGLAVKIPLVISLGGVSHRLNVSIAVDSILPEAEAE